MTLRHVIDYYMDGHKAISFCKICSKEELALLDECTGPIQKSEMQLREDFKNNFPRAAKMLDDKKRNG